MTTTDCRCGRRSAGVVLLAAMEGRQTPPARASDKESGARTCWVIVYMRVSYVCLSVCVMRFEILIEWCKVLMLGGRKVLFFDNDR